MSRYATLARALCAGLLGSGLLATGTASAACDPVGEWENGDGSNLPLLINTNPGGGYWGQQSLTLYGFTTTATSPTACTFTGTMATPRQGSNFAGHTISGTIDGDVMTGRMTRPGGSYMPLNATRKTSCPPVIGFNSFDWQVLSDVETYEAACNNISQDPNDVIPQQMCYELGLVRKHVQPASVGSCPTSPTIRPFTPVLEPKIDPKVNPRIDPRLDPRIHPKRRPVVKPLKPRKPIRKTLPDK